MSEAKETDGKEGKSAKGKKTLSLKRSVESGRAQPSGGGGRSKNVVVVEKKRKRPVKAPGTASSPTSAKTDKAKSEKPVEKSTVQKKATKAKKATTSKNAGSTAKTLSAEEVDARARVLAEARVREVEEKKIAAEEAKRAEERRKVEAKDKAKRDKEKADKAKAEPSVDAKVGKKTTTAKSGDGVATPDKAPVSRADKPATRRVAEKTEGEARKTAEPWTKKVKQERVPPSRTRGDERRHKGKLTVHNALDERSRERSLASLKRQRERLKNKSLGTQEPREKISREVVIPEVITIQELANRMAERAVDVIKFLMKEDQMHKINDLIDADTAELIVEEFGHTAKRVSEADVEEGFIDEEDDAETLKSRPPIVTVMGHVDHGKTSLLDALRKANVVSGEAGGITQHIGAYQVETESGGRVTFIDTPGHEAFTAMRARGAKVTDIVILVVAADDGVMPQTVEAINHAKSAEVPMIVAINKIDKPEADPSRVRTDLLQHEVIVESMSGDTLEVEVSALKGTNLDKLIETVLLQAELLELKANPDRSAEGIVVEAKLERGRGPVGTMLVQRGTLHVGDIIVAGAAWGKVRALIDDHGEHVAVAGPAKPVEVLGFDSAPEAGDQFAVVENEARAREITEYRVRKRRNLQSVGAGVGLSLEQMMSQLKEKGKKEFHLLIKGDTQGSIEAIRAALEQLGNDEVAARVVHSAVGGITESDVSLATASGAVLVGFNVRANAQARAAAEAASAEIRYYAVIYDLVDDVKAAMSGMLSPERRETFIGNAEILEVFNITKVGKVAGCRVTEGKVERGAGVRLIRDDVVIHEGKLSTLKRFKDEVKEVTGGQECGMAFENYQDMRAGDVIECFHVEEVARSL